MNRLFCTTTVFVTLFTTLFVFSMAPCLLAQDAGAQAAPADAEPIPLNKRIDQAATRGITFLKNRGQAPDGSFSSETGVAVTALCVRAMLEHQPKSVDTPAIQKALKFIESKMQGDGGIYNNGSLYRNYETSVAVGALLKANQDGRYESELKKAELFLKEIQWDEGEGIETSDTAFGGSGYGKHKRPDLSNTAFTVEALKELGNDPDDEAIQNALKFVLRTQNLANKGNDTKHADKVGDGGFYYTPAAGGSSQAGVDDGGGLRSYGSMTYAGLKSMIYAGLTAEDPRVEAAMTFIQNNYSLEENPGMGKAGLFYYYHTFAKALDAAKIEVLDDKDGNPHPWRDELTTHLLSKQQSDGAWVNEANDRWMEGDRQLVTAYALLALSHCRE